MNTMPETCYATSGEVSIAYQVLGDGPIDLVYVPPFVSNLELAWEWPPFARFLRNLASFTRLIVLDKRGTGLSDRVTDAATIDERMDDVRAVMDAVGSQRAALLGSSEGGPMCIVFAATFPDRTSHLILYGSYPKAAWAPDYPIGTVPDAYELFFEAIRQNWGRGVLVELFTPSVADDPAFRAWQGRFERQSASPGAAIAIQRMNMGIDVRPMLSTVAVPTLVLYRAREVVAHVDGSRYLAEHIPGAGFVELEGQDFAPYVGDQDAIVAEVQAFLTGVRSLPAPNRVLATVMFTDIVDSTGTAVRLGDAPWRQVLDRHDDLIREQVVAHRGRVVKTTGDGTLAIFDGPTRAIQCALAVRDAIQRVGLAVRVGLHTGEIEVRGDDIGGIAAHVAARVMAAAGPGQVFVSRTVVDLVAGSGNDFDDRGETELKGVPESWRLFAVTG